MSSPLNLSYVNRRNPIRMVEETMDEDMDIIDDEYEDDSKTVYTSDEYSSQSIYQPESFRVSPRNIEPISCSRRIVNNRSSRNLEHTFTPESRNKFNAKPQSQLIGCSTYIIVGALIAIGLLAFGMTQNSEKKCSYDKLRLQYPEQGDKLWRTISISIEHIINGRSKKPAVYLFLHQGGKATQNLVRDIAAQASHCFGEKFQLVEMSKNDFTSPSAIADYGYAIEEFKKKIKRGRVALIVNLNEIPAEAARALHTICDTYSPIAEELVIFLTLVPHSTNGNPVANAENTLMKLWGSLKHSDLDALITRVTDEVIALNSI
ncbi:uncharacterized protein LOC129240379 [Anastrepha obliqua]|uniref:uncharacterized protein LOC129240379 n=1 Tax=Anastrepha obliqua TaxID=95512 RepID=UPI002409026D|nr:uncharacterized protein LOC129240379 [Anastrepha obliqua]